ncbi:MAG: LysM peptidoglycan-binding domain-containing protein [Anaerolineales bacterium]|jgi:murein DD-endopeptidase MepM/ murein hydrolase activator NlpD
MNRFKLLSFSFFLVLLFLSACARFYPSGPATPPNPYNIIGTIVAQTLTAFPSTITQTATLPAQTPQDFISYYFDAINSRNYILTWSLLSDRFKNALNGPSQGGYQGYVDFWNTVNRVTVLDVTHTCQSDVCAVNVTLRLDYNNGQSDTSIYPYALTYDHARYTWLFDVLPPVPTSQEQASPTSTPAGMAIASVPSLPKRPEYKPGELVDYVVQSGDTLPALAAHFDTTSAEIQAGNPQIPVDATTLPPGMTVRIPMPYAPAWGTPIQIMPDSLFVDGPSVNGFDTGEFVSSQPGWLKDYREDIGGAERSGAEIVDIVATNFSISPRALLVLLEYQTGALSQPVPPLGDYPLGHVDVNTTGLYRQLVWAANILNAGYYGWRTDGLTQIVHPDYSTERPDPWQTAATLAFQYYFSLGPLPEYAHATGADGLKVVYIKLFGDPWAETVDLPAIPANLQQPALVLPFPAGHAWSFTGGPHSAWGGAALRPWAAIDFAPPVHGCDISDVPVVAMADGIVARSEAGVVMEDLDGDGNERTGWDILYLHIASEGEAGLGQRLKRGDPVGFASCEGGEATGTNVHIARKYNGEWIPVDSAIPFNLEGWIVHTGDAAYQGTLTRGDQTVTASSYSNAASLIWAGH